MQNYHILWADDEIDLLKPFVLFLEKKDYKVTTVNNGADALEKIENQFFDLVFLDENMPGMSGLETLAQIKMKQPNLPVIMITKSEEEHIMEEAIGSKISDYLVKPIKTSQLLLAIKKILDNKRLVSEKTTQNYQQEFRQLAMAYQDDIDHEQWADIYKKLVFWELEIESTQNKDMFEVLDMQKSEANNNFVRFIRENYENWLNNPDIDKPILSHQLMRKKVFPYLKQTEPVFFILIDNLRFDQWRVIEPLILEIYKIEEEMMYYSILPTTTSYARNAIFSGMMPSDMAKYHADIWVQEDDEDGKNLQEEEFLRRQLQKNRINVKFSYHKVITQAQGRALLQQVNNLLSNQLNAIVFNFVDMLSHARTDSDMIRELMPDESAYRSLTKSWFMHSPLKDLLEKLAEKQVRVIITTDHGTIRVKKPFKIIGDKNVNTNLRYKQGKNLSFKDDDNVLVANKPERFMLPKINVSTTYVFATEDNFFAYPNNYNHYVSYYKDTFQHGGVSMEEIILPFVVLIPKR
ncbi:MAG: PglZ domain-containing protein [Microscillaceae bacterium]|nr:PglZ domain-containing protein [Microscillaceae bacterium]MDW8460046.1 bifunctional response regulator/alkaline phosphatase family protein [Cytophagales bacterium]